MRGLLMALLAYDMTAITAARAGVSGAAMGTTLPLSTKTTSTKTV